MRWGPAQSGRVGMCPHDDRLLCHAFQRDDGQMLAAFVEIHHELQSGARLALDLRWRRGARRILWPVWPWLESRPATGGWDTPVSFVETHDFVRKPEESPCPGHGHHEFANAETYFLVGDALGKAMKRLLGAASDK